MKCIVVPTTAEAMERLDQDQCLPGDLLEWKLSAQDYAALCDRGVFSALNQALGILIDDYEDAAIQGQAALTLALATVSPIVGEAALGQQWVQLNRTALAYNTGLFFYF